MTADSCRHVRDNFYSFRLDASEASETRGARQPRDKFTHRNKNRLLVLNEPPPLPPPPPPPPFPVLSLSLCLFSLSCLFLGELLVCLPAKRRTRRGSRERLPTAAPLDQGHFCGGFARIKAKMAAAATRPPTPPPPHLHPAS